MKSFVKLFRKAVGRRIVQDIISPFLPALSMRWSSMLCFEMKWGIGVGFVIDFEPPRSTLV